MSRSRITRLTLVLLAVGAMATPLSAAPTGAATSRPLVCASKGFMATIRSGPDHGVAVKGELVFERVPSGATGGALTTSTGVVPFAGAIDGRSFDLALPTTVGAISGVRAGRVTCH